jgi:hypothetical protein
MAREGQHTNRNMAWALGLLLALCVCSVAAIDSSESGVAPSYRRRLLGDHKYKQNDPVPLYAAKVRHCRLIIITSCRSRHVCCSAATVAPVRCSLSLLLLPCAGWAVCQSQVRNRQLLVAGPQQVVAFAHAEHDLLLAVKLTSTTSCHTASQRMGSGTRRWAWER